MIAIKTFVDGAYPYEKTDFLNVLKSYFGGEKNVDILNEFINVMDRNGKFYEVRGYIYKKNWVSFYDEMIQFLKTKDITFIKDKLWNMRDAGGDYFFKTEEERDQFLEKYFEPLLILLPRELSIKLTLFRMSEKYPYGDHQLIRNFLYSRDSNTLLNVLRNVRDEKWNEVEKTITEYFRKPEMKEKVQTMLFQRVQENLKYNSLVNYMNSNWFTSEDVLTPSRFDNKFKQYLNPNQNFVTPRNQQITSQRITTTKSPIEQLQEVQNDFKNYLISLFPESTKIIEKFMHHMIEEKVAIKRTRELRAMSMEEFLGLKGSLMMGFITKYRKEFATDCLNEMGKSNKLKILEEGRVLDGIDSKMIFEPREMKRYLENEIKRIHEESLALDELERTLDRKLPEFFHKNKKFTKFLTQHITTSAETYEKYKDLVEENGQNFYNLDDEIINEFLKRKLKYFMNINFPDSRDLNDKFITCLSSKKSNQIYENYDEKINNVIDMQDELIKEFFDKNLDDEVAKALSYNQVSVKNVKEYGIMDEIDMEMLFKPEKLKKFLNENICKKGVISIKRNSVNRQKIGKTPDSCIINEMCKNATIENWNEAEMREKIENEYNRSADLKFDEADDIFLALLADEVKERKLKFDGKCVAAFFEREKNLKNLYNIDLISDQEEFNKVFTLVVNEYEKI